MGTRSSPKSGPGLTPSMNCQQFTRHRYYGALKRTTANFWHFPRLMYTWFQIDAAITTAGVHHGRHQPPGKKRTGRRSVHTASWVRGLVTVERLEPWLSVFQQKVSTWTAVIYPRAPCENDQGDLSNTGARSSPGRLPGKECCRVGASGLGSLFRC